MARTATAEWKGDLMGGGGTVALGSGAFEGAYSFATRFEDKPGANPEELLGAAHAGCFSMALANSLAKAGFTATSVKTGKRRPESLSSDTFFWRIPNSGSATFEHVGPTAISTSLDA